MNKTANNLRPMSIRWEGARERRAAWTAGSTYGCPAPEALVRKPTRSSSSRRLVRLLRGRDGTCGEDARRYASPNRRASMPRSGQPGEDGFFLSARLTIDVPASTAP